MRAREDLRLWELTLTSVKALASFSTRPTGESRDLARFWISECRSRSRGDNGEAREGENEVD